MTPPSLRVAALVDLERSPQAGGHVKCWERLAQAAAEVRDGPLDLTVFFSGPASRDEDLAPHVRLRHVPRVFSTKNLRLPYVPDHTDLAPFNPTLARALGAYDVLHTTEGFFSFSRTAERVSRQTGAALVTSFHTDVPAYARIFTAKTIEHIFGQGLVTRVLRDTLRMPERQERRMVGRLHRHLSRCQAALVARREDHHLAEGVLGPARVHIMRLGVDKALFAPTRADRAALMARYGIPPDRFILLFVGRLDVGKNILTLVEAVETLKAEGLPVHLIAAGQGPAEATIRQRLGDSVTLPGFVAPADLAPLYASVDLFTLPSEVEIRSMAVGEALASGCPVVSAAKSGIAPLFNAGTAIGVVDGGGHAWAHALRQVILDPAVRQGMRQAARHYGQTRLATWGDVLMDDVLGSWQDAARERRAGTPARKGLRTWSEGTQATKNRRT